MTNSIPYLDYWRKRQQRQKEYHQKLAKAAKQKVQEIAELLIAEYPIQKIILFGSLVKGNFHAESDLDLAVAGIPESLYFEALAKVNHISDRPVDLKPLESLDEHFLKKVIATGECIYASDDRDTIKGDYHRH